LIQVGCPLTSPASFQTATFDGLHDVILFATIMTPATTLLSDRGSPGNLFSFANWQTTPSVSPNQTTWKSK
jgi:hypothetical protein